MLLVAKSSNRVVKQTQEEATATLALPIALLHHVTPTIQVTAFVEFLKESQRLVTCAVDPVNKTPTLLDHILYVSQLNNRSLSNRELGMGSRLRAHT